MITIGIDPHKSTLTAVGLSPDGTVLATTRLPVNTATLGELLAFADSWPQRRWAVEGAAGLGLGIAQRLVAHGEDVVDVPAHLGGAGPAAVSWPWPQDRRQRRRRRSLWSPSTIRACGRSRPKTCTA